MERGIIMRKHKGRILLTVMLLTATLAGNPALGESAQPGTLTDMKGREIQLNAPATRVVVV